VRRQVSYRNVAQLVASAVAPDDEDLLQAQAWLGGKAGLFSAIESRSNAHFSFEGFAESGPRFIADPFSNFVKAVLGLLQQVTGAMNAPFPHIIQGRDSRYLAEAHRETRARHAKLFS
jgi:hypothetical protein